MVLPALPKHGLRFEQNDTVKSTAGYLHLTAFTVTKDGGPQKAHYDMVGRKALDAAVVVPYFERDGTCFVRLRTVVRPPLAVRPPPPPGTAMPPDTLWEVPAGLIEPGETAETGALRELYEELAVRPESIVALGPPACPAPAALGEIHVYFAARLAPPRDDADLPVPEGDGSLYEENAAFVTVPLTQALDACRRGEVWDSKTELALRRLAELVAP